jgi:hypothetical protein
MKGKAKIKFISHLMLDIILDGEKAILFLHWNRTWKRNPNKSPQTYGISLLFKNPFSGTKYAARSAQKTSLLDVLSSNLNERYLKAKSSNPRENPKWGRGRQLGSLPSWLEFVSSSAWNKASTLL